MALIGVVSHFTVLEVTRLVNCERPMAFVLTSRRRDVIRTTFEHEGSFL